MTAEIDDKTIEAKVEEKQKAEQKYDDAIASGKSAALMERSKHDDGFTLSLGNLHPGKTAKINVQLSKFLEIESGAFAFRLPVNYFPDYTTVEKLSKIIIPSYKIDYKLEVKSVKPIIYMSTPAHTQTEVKIEQKHLVVSNTAKGLYKFPKRD